LLIHLLYGWAALKIDNHSPTHRAIRSPLRRVSGELAQASVARQVLASGHQALASTAWRSGGSANAVTARTAAAVSAAEVTARRIMLSRIGVHEALDALCCGAAAAAAAGTAAPR
jgi:hypothetical protein